MQIESLDRSRYQSVTERLSSRLDALEPIVARLLANEAKLIADSITAQREMALLADLLTGVQADARETERDLRIVDRRISDSLATFRSMSFWQRLRWLLTGDHA